MPGLVGLATGWAAMNENLPAFVVLVADSEQPRAGAGDLRPALGQRLSCRRKHQGVSFRIAGRSGALPQQSRRRRRCRSAADARRADALNEMQLRRRSATRKRRRASRSTKWRSACRPVGAGADRPLRASREHDLRAVRRRKPTKPGTFAANCLLARRLAERGVRFIQIYHRGWDQHGNLPSDMPRPVPETSTSPAAALRRGPQAARPARRHARHLGRRVRPHDLLPGRPVQDELRPRPSPALLHASGWPAAACKGGHDLRRDRRLLLQHRPRPVHIHDLHATILHLLGIDHERFTFRYQGRDEKLNRGSTSSTSCRS